MDALDQLEQLQPPKPDSSLGTTTPISVIRHKRKKRKRRRLVSVGERLVHSPSKSPGGSLPIKKSEEPDALLRRFQDVIGKSHHILKMKRMNMANERLLQNAQLKLNDAIKEKRQQIREEFKIKKEVKKRKEEAIHFDKVCLANQIKKNRAEAATKVLEFKANERERKKDIRNHVSVITPDKGRPTAAEKDSEILSAYGAQPYHIPDAQKRWGSKLSNYGKNSFSV